jgi:hypothetical protein
MKNFGLNVHRFRDNPEEKRIAEAWERLNVTGNIVDYLLDRRQVRMGRPPEAGDVERAAIATVIQWLGSPVGQSWLRELGYERRVESNSLRDEENES